jgi:hypothetical protein
VSLAIAFGLGLAIGFAEGVVIARRFFRGRDCQYQDWVSAFKKGARKWPPDEH